MIFSYIHNIVKFKKWKYSLAVLFIFVVMLVVYQPVVDQLLELHKCPACYGNSACDYINNVRINRYDFFTTFSYFLDVKNVFFGTLGERKIVLKKLAHSSELNDFDRMLCENVNFSGLCSTKTEVAFDKHVINFDELIKKEVTVDFTKDNFSRLRVCPTTRSLNSLFQNVFFNDKNVDRKTLEVNIWTLASLNPEPLLLQILPVDDGWPVPKYLGACGRIIIEEYVGLPLTAYYHAPWSIRAKIASSLLSSAYGFTFRDTNFAYYLTDISADNIAVDSHNNAKFVDLENVIVVDKNALVESAVWEELQENVENLTCSNCLAFSSVDICNHKISDHNYYAICQFLLALNKSSESLPGGLLHDMPRDVLEKYPDIEYLIQQCARPKPPHTRITAGIRLRKILDAVVEKQRE